MESKAHVLASHRYRYFKVNIFIVITHFHNEKWYVDNIFTTNLKWKIVTGCYCWGKNIILVLVSNLNQ